MGGSRGGEGGRGPDPPLFVCSVALCPKSIALVMGVGQFTKPHFFLGKLEQAVNQYYVHILSLVTDNNPS